MTIQSRPTNHFATDLWMGSQVHKFEIVWVEGGKGTSLNMTYHMGTPL